MWDCLWRAGWLWRLLGIKQVDSGQEHDVSGRRYPDNTFKQIFADDCKLPRSHTLLQLCNNDTILTLIRVLPDLGDLQARIVQKSAPLRLGTLCRAETRHHDHVELGGAPRGVSLRKHHLVDQEDRVLRHARFDVGQNLGTLVRRPVMQDVAKVVCTGA